MEVKQENFELIDGFTKVCNDIIDGKFILADMRISNLFKFIDAQPELSDLFSRALQNFSFEKEITKCKINNDAMGRYFKLPEDNVKIIALVYCILQDVNTNKLDLYAFINTYFKNTDDTNNSSYSNFCLKVIVPFRDIVISALQDKFEIMPLEVNMQPEAYNNDEAVDGFEKLERVIDQMLETLKYETKIKPDLYQDIEIVLKGLKQSAKLKSYSIMGAIAIGLDYMVRNNKPLRRFYADLQDALSELY